MKMADDDIDIEEHDLLDNPQIRSIFPDISLLKKEIQNCFDEGPVIKQESVSSRPQDFFMISTSEIVNLKPEIDAGLSESLKATKSTSNSKIKDTGSAIKDADLFENGRSTVEKPSEGNLPKPLPMKSNKIILGSKPNKCLEYEDFFEKQVKPDLPSVLLDDLGPYLLNSNRYCADCLILFPNKSVLDAHEKVVHIRQEYMNSQLHLKPKQGIVKHNDSYYDNKCNLCGTFFSTRGSLSRHHKNVHSENIEASVTDSMTKIQNDPKENDKTTSSPKNTCFHCKISFPTQQLLIEHLYNILQSKKESCDKASNMVSNKDNLKDQNKNDNKIITDSTVKCPDNHDENTIDSKSENVYYKCYICSYYFKTAKYCIAHVTNKHNITKHPEIIKEPYNSKCNYCSLELGNISAYNIHIKQSHNQQYTTTTTRNDSGMCDEDEKIKNDQPSKNAQKSINVDNPLIYTSTLFKCNKCDIHFISARVAMNHSDHMEMLINWKCSTCQRIFKKEEELLHVKQHLSTSNFIILNLSSSELSRVLYNCPKCTVHYKEDNFINHYPGCGVQTPNSVYCKVCDILIDHIIGRSHQTEHQNESFKSSDFTIIESNIIADNDGMEHKKSHKLKRKTIASAKVAMKKKRFDLEYLCKLSYCNTCKCFITYLSKLRSVHHQSRCKHLVKYVCKICGLVLTSNAYKTHKSLHDRRKGLKLQDFTFYERGKQICPPIPEFPKCNFCDVCFISKVAAKTHECIEEDYLTCHICEMKLSEEAFKLHMSFHNYSKDNKNIGTLSDIPCILSTRESSPLGNRKHAKQDASVNKSLIKTQRNFNSESNLLAKSKIIPHLKKDLDVAFLFSCRECNVTVDTYEKVIEHCQGHYSHAAKQINIEMCHLCDLKLDSTCYEKHQTLHLRNYDKKSFKVLTFDTFYFTSENDVWVKHIFGAIPQDQIDKIVDASIYKFECRIKMEVIQDGPSNLTVYKCNKCRCFIDGSSLYRHAENACFKLRKHPCSFCGLPFLSAVSRTEHEKIHKKSNIGVKSYRIVIFNRDEDKTFNSALYSYRQYILYQCRNCDAVVDKSRVNHHKCNKKDFKKCVACGLLLHREEHESHVLRHKELVSFTADNLKVILFGSKGEPEAGSSGGLVSSFNGSVYDYTFYSCIQCKICVKTIQCTLQHSCVFGASVIKCPYCALDFTMAKIKYHRKLHETDRDFIRENMNIITFNSPASKELLMTDPVVTSNCNHSDFMNIKASNNMNNQYNKGIAEDNLENHISNDYIERYAKIYKCACGLHFLDESSIATHFEICNPRIRASKQKCTKCDMLFTPNILFNHLVIHHGNKKHVYKFDIIEIDKERKVLHKCFKCALHFIREKDAKEHLKACNINDKSGIECTVCHLMFDKTSIILHKDYNKKKCLCDYEVIDINIDKNYSLESDMRYTPLDIATPANTKERKGKPEFNNYNATIYKCKECGIHYLTKKSIKSHLGQKHDRNLTKLQDICTICGLNFVTSILPKHITIHHETLNLKANDLIVIECVEDK